ncbi:tape measure protein [Microcystis phage Mwe-JY26]
MAETHSLRLEIDGSAARRGAADYAAAIKKIETATQRMVSATDTSLSRLERRIGNVNFSKIASSISVLNGIKVNRQTVFAIDALSKSLSSIVGVRPVAVKTINDFSAAIRSIQTSGVNLKRISDISNALSSFRAPTQTQLRNLQSFVNVINNLRPPANAGSVVAQIQRITNAINQLRASMQALNTGGPGTLRLPRVVGGGVTGGGSAAAAAGGGGSGGGWTRAYGGMLRQGNAPIPPWMGAGPGRSSMAGMRGFENTFSLPYQAGSAIRSAAGAMTMGNLLTQIVRATDSTTKFETSIAALGLESDKTEQVVRRFNATVVAYGMDLASTRDNFASFAHAVVSAGVEVDRAQGMFENAALVMNRMGMDNNQQEGALRALGQMFSKGRIMSEELFQQMAEHWRGFPAMVADTLGITLPQLRERMQREVLDPKILERVIERARYAAELAMARNEAATMNRPILAINRLKTAWQELLTDLGKGPVGNALFEAFERLAEILRQPEFRDFANRFGLGLADVVQTVGNAALWASQNLETIGTALKVIVGIAAINFMGGLAGSIANLVTPLMLVGRTAAQLAPSFSSFGAAAVAAVRLVMGPWGLLVGAVALIGTSLVDSINKFNSAGDAGFSAGELISAGWGLIQDAIGDAVSWGIALWDRFTSYISRKWAETLTSVTNGIRSLPGGEAFLSGVGWVSRQVTGAAQGVAGAVTSVTDQAAQNIVQEAQNRRAAQRAERERAAAEARERSALRQRAAERRMENLIDQGGPARLSPNDAFQPNNDAASGRRAARERERFEDFRARLDPTYGVGEALDDGMALISGALSRGQVTAAEAVDLQERLRNSILETAGAADPAARAQQRLNEVTAIANGLVERRIIDQDRANQIIETARLNLEEQLNPYEYQLRLMREETELLGMSSRQMEVEQRVRRIVNDLKRDGVIVTDEMTAALRREAEANIRAARAQRDSEEGLAAWANSFRSIDVELRKLESTIATDLTDALAEFVTTGKASFNDLAQSIVRDINRLIIQNGIRELARSLGLISGDNSSGFSGGGLTGAVGGLFSGIFGSGGLFGGGGEMARPSPDFIGPMPSSGGLLSGVGSWLASFFQEGGVSTNPVSRGLMPASAFVNAPHYAEGTANTRGGIPAVLHPNEAVIPLSRNRRVPVEMKGGGGGATIVMNISTPDANSFRKSQAQIARDFGTAFNRQMSRNT